ncbi:MAG: flagellar biosynthesis protein FlgC [Alphaproteobacteria bacterium]|nr:flagellar biosynthesis protein FlgC [Alphaproteobacteria bacterium]
MAINGIGASLSGLFAAATRLAGAASNIANLRSQGKALDQPIIPDPNAAPDPGYQPLRTEQVSVEGDGGNGTRAFYAPVRPASIPSLEPGAPDADARGFVARPNVQLETEVTDQIVSVRTFQANVKSLQTNDELNKTLLDIKT